MWSIRTAKSSAATPSKGKRRRRLGQRGQVFVEYVLVLAVVIGIFLALARPFLGRFSKQYQRVFKSGMFKEDSSGENFYYFPVK